MAERKLLLGKATLENLFGISLEDGDPSITLLLEAMKESGFKKQHKQGLDYYFYEYDDEIINTLPMEILSDAFDKYFVG